MVLLMEDVSSDLPSPFAPKAFTSNTRAVSCASAATPEVKLQADAAVARPASWVTTRRRDGLAGSAPGSLGRIALFRTSSMVVILRLSSIVRLFQTGPDRIAAP